jgi:hypothetical protein
MEISMATMQAAIFGLLGVALGAALAVLREWWFQGRKTRKEAEYLAVRVSCALEAYVSGCSDVAGDDGLCDGQPDEKGYSHIQVTAPKFEPDALAVEWKSLPRELMYRVLDLPLRAEEAAHRVSGAFRYQASPPDYSEGFEERQFQYALLGLAASDLAADLRRYVGLPGRAAGEWDPVQFMREQKAKIDSLRAERARQHQLHPIPI